ncbi:MAG: NUDIX hydrolase [Ruminococcaceae bacterium]|nr:NUDIX hydrolase [Oscillospiraceae bacterium]
MFKGRVFTVEVSKVELPDGQTSTREIIRHNGGAAIVALDDERNIFLVRQFRIATGQEMLEIPAGKLEAGEDPLVCAKRELEEETGMQAGEIKHLFSMYATPGYCGERLHIYFADNLKSGQIHRDEEEFLHVIKVPFDEAYKMVMEGKFQDAKTIAGILAVKNLIK